MLIRNSLISKTYTRGINNGKRIADISYILLIIIDTVAQGIAHTIEIIN